MRRAVVVLMGVLLQAGLAGTLQAQPGKGTRTTATGMRSIPDGWKLVGDRKIPKNDVGKLSQRYGTPLTAVATTVFEVGGARVDVLLFECKDASGAPKLERGLGKARIPLLARRRRGRLVVATNQVNRLADFRRILRSMDWDRERYEVRFQVGLVEGAVGAQANRVSNLFIAWGRTTNKRRRAAIEAEVKRLSKAWKPVKTLRLFTPSRPDLTVALEEHPGATARREGEYTILTYKDPPLRCGIPYATVTIAAMVAESEKGRPDAPAADKALRAGTPWWPVEDPAVKALAGAPVAKQDPVAGIKGLLVRVYRAVKHGGEQMGTRVGVETAIERRVGRCWDQSDVFVACARARGVASRQLAGWLVDGGGHVWAEVHIPGKGWLGADPSGAFLGRTTRHIPYLATDDGKLSVVYIKFPEITRTAN